MELDTNMILAMIPLVVIQIGLIVVCLVDWLKRRSFRYLPRIAWLVVFLVFSLVGPIAYLVLGRQDDDSPLQ